MMEQKLVPYSRRRRLVPDDGLQRARAAVKRAQASILQCGCPCARCVAAAVDLAEALRILTDDAASSADASGANTAPKEAPPTDGNAVSATSAVIGTASARSARTSEPVSGRHQGGAQRAHQAGEGVRDAKRRARAGPGREPGD